jgi:hypothetical protein
VKRTANARTRKRGPKTLEHQHPRKPARHARNHSIYELIDLSLFHALVGSREVSFVRHSIDRFE